MSAKRDSSNGACASLVSDSNLHRICRSMHLPGERRRHRRGRRYVCREKGLPVLDTSQSMPHHPKQDYTRRLKLVTGVDISTRPVRRSGREGNAKNRSSLRAVAKPKRSAFRRSMTIMRQLSPQQLPTTEMRLLKAPIVQLKLRCVQNGDTIASGEGLAELEPGKIPLPRRTSKIFGLKTSTSFPLFH